MKYRVLFPKVLLRPLNKEEDSPIVIDITPTDPARGEILAVGKPPNKEVLTNGGSSPIIQKGEVVYYFPRNATEITIEGEKLLLIEEDDILFIENYG